MQRHTTFLQYDAPLHRLVLIFMLYYFLTFMEYMYTHQCVVRGSCTHICKKRLREYSLRRLCLYEYEVYSCIKNMSRDFVYNFLSLFIQNELWIGHLFVRLPAFILLFSDITFLQLLFCYYSISCNIGSVFQMSGSAYIIFFLNRGSAF